MKLLEVLGKPEKSIETQDDYISRLRDRGMRKVGSGVQSNVYQHPQFDKIVVKVSREEQAPLAYLKYVLTHQSNPYVPKVYHVRRFRTKERGWGSEYYIAFIEKLTEYKLLRPLERQRIVKTHLGPDIVAWLGGDKKYNPYAFEYMAEPEGLALMRASNKKLGVPSKHLIDVMSFISKHTASLDLHHGNIMLRGSHPVITDPVV